MLGWLPDCHTWRACEAMWLPVVANANRRWERANISCHPKIRHYRQKAHYLYGTVVVNLYPVTFTVVAKLVCSAAWGGARPPDAGGWAGFSPWQGPLGWRMTLVVMGLTQLLDALSLHALLVRRHPEDLEVWPHGGTAISVLPHFAEWTSYRAGLHFLHLVRTIGQVALH